MPLYNELAYLPHLCSLFSIDHVRLVHVEKMPLYIQVVALSSVIGLLVDKNEENNNTTPLHGLGLSINDRGGGLLHLTDELDWDKDDEF